MDALCIYIANGSDEESLVYTDTLCIYIANGSDEEFKLDGYDVYIHRLYEGRR